MGTLDMLDKAMIFFLVSTGVTGDMDLGVAFKGRSGSSSRCCLFQTLMTAALLLSSVSFSAIAQCVFRVPAFQPDLRFPDLPIPEPVRSHSAWPETARKREIRSGKSFVLTQGDPVSCPSADNFPRFPFDNCSIRFHMCTSYECFLVSPH
jgi:hypothetical protein